MAITVSALGTAQGKSSVATLTYANGLVASAGDVILILAAVDNANAGATFYDSSATKYYQFQCMSYAQNVTNVCVQLFALRLPVTTAASDSVTVTEFDTSQSVAITVYKATGLGYFGSIADTYDPDAWGGIQAWADQPRGGCFFMMEPGTITSLDLKLCKYGLPTGTGYIRFRDQSGNQIGSDFASFDVGALTGTLTWKTFTGSFTNPTLQTIYLTVEYTGGSSSAMVEICGVDFGTYLGAHHSGVQYSDADAKFSYLHAMMAIRSVVGTATIWYSVADKQKTATGTGTTPSSGATPTLSQATELGLALIGLEGPTGDAAGTWDTGANNISGNEQRVGTTGGSQTSNVIMTSAVEVLAATTAQTGSKTGVGSRDWVAHVVTLLPSPIRLIVTPGDYDLTGTEPTLIGPPKQYSISVDPGSFTYTGTDVTFEKIGVGHPKYYTGLVAWQKGDAITGLNDGDNCATWIDSGANGYDATWVSGSYPVYKTNIKNGKAVLRFTGSTSPRFGLVDTGALDAWRNKQYGAFFAVVKPADTNKGDVVFVEDGTNGVGRAGICSHETGLEGHWTGFGRRLDGDSAGFVTGTAEDAADNWYIVSWLIEWVNGIAHLRVNKVADGEDHTFQTPGSTSDTQSWSIQIGSSGGAAFLTGDVAEVIWYNDQITEAEALEIENELDTRWAVTAGAPKVLTATPGDYDLTGTQPTLKQDTRLVPDTTLYSMTGAQPTLTQGYRMICDAGSFTQGKTDPTLSVNHRLIPDTTSYTYTGVDTTLTKAVPVQHYNYPVDPGSYSQTGVQPTLKADRRIISNLGDYDLTGTQPTLKQTYQLAADTTLYSQVGTNPTLEQGYKAIPDAGDYDLTGVQPTLEQGYKLVADTTAYAQIGVNPTLRADRKLIPAAGDYDYIGVDPTLKKTSGYTLGPDTGSFGLTGTEPSLRATRKLVPDTTAYTQTGTNVILGKGKTITSAPGEFAYAGTSADLRATRRLSPDAGSYVYTGVDATLQKISGYTLSFEPGSFQLAGTQATLYRTWKYTVNAGDYDLTGIQSSLLRSLKLSPDAGGYTLNGAAQTLLYNRKILTNVGTLSLTGIEINFSYIHRLWLDAGSYSLTGTAADLKKTSGYTLSPNVGSFQISGTQASLRADRKLYPSTTSYAYSGINASLLQGYKATLNVGSYSLAGIDLSLHAARWASVLAGSFSYSGINPTLLAERKLYPTIGSYSYSGTEITYDRIFHAWEEAGTYTYTGVPVTLTKAGPGFYILVANPGNYSLSGVDPTLRSDRRYSVDAGGYSLSGTALSLYSSHRLLPEAGIYALNGSVLSLLVTRYLGLSFSSYSLTGLASILLADRKLIPTPGVDTLTGNSVDLLVRSTIAHYTLSAISGIYLLTGGFIYVLDRFSFERELQIHRTVLRDQSIDQSFEREQQVSQSIDIIGTIEREA